MESVNLALFNREVFGHFPCDLKQNWHIRSEFQLCDLKIINPGWIQANDNFLAFISEKGGLTVYNTIACQTTFISKDTENIIKAWFYHDNLLVVAISAGLFEIWELQLKYSGAENKENCEKAMKKVVKCKNAEGICGIDVRENLVVVKYFKNFSAFELGGVEWNFEYKGDCRYVKGFTLDLCENEIVVRNVKNGSVWKFIPNFPGIFHLDIIKSTVLAYSDAGYCTFNLNTRVYKEYDQREVYKYFEIEVTGESIALYSNQEAFILTPEEIPIIGCEEIFSVCDNFKHIFILSSAKVYTISKINYTVQFFCLESPKKLIGCNENDCEIYVVDSNKISIFI